MSLLVYLDYAGIALFAATGALAASRKQLDLIGFLFFISREREFAVRLT